MISEKNLVVSGLQMKITKGDTQYIHVSTNYK